MRWAIVDVETTGLHVVSDKIIEIAVRIRTDKGLGCTWHRFINPERTIPGVISALTGITNEMVHHAPTIDAIAKELFELLHDCVLVAHNARFDFGFLKNAFKRAGYTYKAPVLCTIKLMKSLSPKLTNYKLSSLAALYNIEVHNEHRALGDVETLDALIQHLFNEYSQEDLLTVAQSLYKKSSIPSKLTTDINAFPNTPGVYLFYSKKTTAPIYIGKSVNLRQRILSHFQADYTHAKEFTMAQHIERVEIIPTAGELSALLLESALIKEKMPIYNRRLRRMKQSVGFKLKKENGYTTISLERYLLEENTDLSSLNLYGTFRSIAAAKRILMALVKRHHLCPKLTHLERSAHACFSYQLKRCKGACINEEPQELYNQRVDEALEEYQDESWPYSGAIAIKEHCPINKITQFLIIHQWRFLGVISCESQLKNWSKLPVKMGTYHYDAYKILVSYFKNKSDHVLIELEKI